MSLSYKDFQWPNDPYHYGEVLRREPEYITIDGITSYDGMGAARRVISGSGVFFGSNAYWDYRDLLNLAKEDTPGKLLHSVWGERYCYFTKLELNRESREDYISYSFEFIQAEPDGTVPR